MEKELSKKPILVTAALPYINNIAHLGHLVGSHLPADIFARYCRLKNYDVLFIGGSDENGTPSELAAQEVGVGIKEFCDKLYQEHKKIYQWFNISYDNFSRTSKKLHHKTAQEFFKKVYENGYISKAKLELPFCQNDRRFLPDRYVKGTCPKCGDKNANGNQCEKCGSLLAPNELIDPKCTICGLSPVFKKTEHLFFRLDKLSDQIEDWLNTKKDLWSPPVFDWALGLIKEGLKPRCITRDIKHGVKVPLEDFKIKNKVIFVWFEALTAYISFTKEIMPEKWKEFWENSEARIFHFLGKDNIPFHSVFFPGMLIAHGGLNLPYKVVGLQYLNYEGGKFSKSKHWGIFCENLPKAGLEPDYWRFYLSFLIPETVDTDFKWDVFREKINGELIGNLANFIHRTLSFIYNKLDGNIVKPFEFSELDKNLIQTIKNKTEKIDEYLAKTELRRAFEEILALSQEGNKYFSYNAPWRLIKEDKDRANAVLYICANLCRSLAILISPYLPDTSEKIWKQLNLEGKVYKRGIWNSAGEIVLPTKHKINKPYILFDTIDDELLNQVRDFVLDIKDLRNFFKN